MFSSPVPRLWCCLAVAWYVPALVLVLYVYCGTDGDLFPVFDFYLTGNVGTYDLILCKKKRNRRSGKIRLSFWTRFCLSDCICLVTMSGCVVLLRYTFPEGQI